MHFIVANAAKHDLDESSLVQEIQQLGLPKENSEAVGKLFREKKDAMRERFAMDSYTVSKLLKTDWRIDTVIASSVASSNEVVTHLKLTCDTRTQDGILPTDSIVVDGYRIKELAFEIDAEKLDVLVHELSRAQAVLDSLEG